MLIADRFDSPVGTSAEREGTEIPPGNWYSSNNYSNYYQLKPGIFAYHTGSDLLLWPGGGAHEPIHACANGFVTFAKRIVSSTWGDVIVIGHTLPDGSEVYSRYGHVESMLVKAGDLVNRGQQIASEGNSYGQFAYHLHFDISKTKRLLQYPADWPGLDRTRLRTDYVDPLVFIREHREVKETSVATLEELRAVRAKAADVVTAIDALLGPAPEPRTMYAKVDGLRIRQQPSTAAQILRELSIGESVTISASDGQWATVLSPVPGFTYAPSLSATRPNP